jgi:hypothetical protein
LDITPPAHSPFSFAEFKNNMKTKTLKSLSIKRSPFPGSDHCPQPQSPPGAQAHRLRGILTLFSSTREAECSSRKSRGFSIRPSFGLQFHHSLTGLMPMIELLNLYRPVSLSVKQRCSHFPQAIKMNGRPAKVTSTGPQ